MYPQGEYINLAVIYIEGASKVSWYIFMYLYVNGSSVKSVFVYPCSWLLRAEGLWTACKMADVNDLHFEWGNLPFVLIHLNVSWAFRNRHTVYKVESTYQHEILKGNISC